MRVLVTRPQPQAGAWSQRLRARGVDAAALPLMRIEPAGDAALLAQAWRDLARYDLVVFVSPNAVTHFFAVPAATPWPAGPLAAAPGPGTGAALAQAGVPAAQRMEPALASVQFDSEALWAQLRHQPWQKRPVLIVRGEGGRDWLAATLRDAGAQVDFVQAYRSAAPVPDAAESDLLRQALAVPQDFLWLFSSSEALAHLERLAPATDWSRLRALATHPRIAQRAQQLGVVSVRCVSPAIEDIVDAVKGSQDG